MITLFQFRPIWGLPNLSPFCIKTETYLKMAKIPYQSRTAWPSDSPKEHLPFIVNETTHETVADSNVIADYLVKHFGNTLDSHLTPVERATGIAFEKLFEDHLYYVGIYIRWFYPPSWPLTRKAYFGHLKGLKGFMIPRIARKRICKRIYEQGMGYNSPEEIFALGIKSLNAVSDFLGNKKYFLGDHPSSTDATAFAFLSSLTLAPLESPLRTHAKKLTNLRSYCERILNEYYPELAQDFKNQRQSNAS